MGGKPTQGRAQLREATLAAVTLARWGGFSGELRTGQLVSLVCVGLGIESSVSRWCGTPTHPAEPWGAVTTPCDAWQPHVPLECCGSAVKG